VKRTLLEVIIVGVVGLTVALAANALSPHGLKLSRDYFQTAKGPATNIAAVATNKSGAPVPDAQSLAAKVAARLQQKGLKLADSDQVHELFQDPRYQQGLIVFIDSRDDTHYLQGHIPGAWQLDYYRYETYLPAVLPACMMAQEIVVYCNGGECEDSEFTALLLRDAQIPLGKIRVYAGGLTEWRTNGWPVETGARNSGQLAPK
jgi:rhodanese-related sulfurtransferase